MLRACFVLPTYVALFAAPTGGSGDGNKSPRKNIPMPKDLGPDEEPAPKQDPFVPAAVRTQQLEELFRQFDLDDGGAIGADELMMLGQMRRTTGQKVGTWTKEMNQRMVARMTKDKGASGDINMQVCDRLGLAVVTLSVLTLFFPQEFVAFFDQQLPFDHGGWKEEMDKFFIVARKCREMKMKGTPLPDGGGPKRGIGSRVEKTLRDSNSPRSSPKTADRYSRFGE